MSVPPWAARLNRLAEQWQASGCDGCVISSLVNIHYLTGLSASAGLLVQSRSATWLLLDGRYVTVARESAAAGRLGPVEIEPLDGRFEDELARVLARAGLRRVAFEAEHVTVATLATWRREGGPEWVQVEPMVEPLRLRKDAGELAILRRAGARLSEVANRLPAWVQAGRSEREVAADIDHAIVAAGFSKPAFDTIVASGTNSARPHARPTEKRLEAGDLVVLDFGGVLEGYCVDLTRMAGIGSLPPEAVRLYEAVRQAHGAALARVRSGVAANQVDAAARQVLERQGLGDAFSHGTGHGLGLEVHEAPRISRLCPPGDVLEASMVCTIEPGAYVPGLGGARLEDDVVVTDDGAELLTTASRDLLMTSL